VTVAPPSSQQTKEDLYQRIAFSDEAQVAIDRQQPVADNIRTLNAAACFHDAVLLLAHALPKREAAWWACQCARSTLPKEAPPRERAAIDLAESWAMKPDNDKRLKALAEGDAIGSYAAAGMVALAAGWSAGNISADQTIDVPPPPHLSAVAVAAAVTLAAAADPDQMDAHYQRFIEEGLKIMMSTR
jgi:hypothetical protein